MVKKDLYRVRNFHQTISSGIFASLPFVALQEVTGGRGLVDQMQIAFDEPAKMRSIDRSVPSELETIIHQALAKNPEERYASATELAADFDVTAAFSEALS